MLTLTTGRVQDKAKLTAAGWTAIDVTVKSAGNAKPLAPTWGMVMGYKRGELTEEEYTQQYMEILARSQKELRGKWERTLQNHEKIALLCYCRRDEFCHRTLLRDEMARFARQELGIEVTIRPE